MVVMVLQRERRRIRWGVRLKSTVVATVIVAVAMAIGAVIMLAMLYRSQNQVMYGSTSSRAYGIADQIGDHGLSGVSPSALTPTTGTDIIQVIDQAGRVVYASPDNEITPIGTLRPAPETVARFEGRVTGLSGVYCGAAAGAEHAGQRYVVIAVVAADTYRRGVLTTAAILALEFPVVLAVCGLAIYVFVGRALRPVHRITSEVSAITSTDLACRVPVPDSDDEIATLARTMNRMLHRLERSRDSQVQFLGDASHELRGPLTTLSGILDLADHTGTDVTVDTVRDVLLPEATRMRAVVDDLLLLARVDERGLALVRSDVDLDDLVLAEAAKARALGGAVVRTDIAAVRVTADATQLARCLRNLVDNALRYSNGTVTLALRAEGGCARVTVGDDGPGIRPEDRERVFYRFVRLDAGRSHGGGSGLGLAIAAEIAAAHGGSIGIDDGPLGGAAFTLTLPLVPARYRAGASVVGADQVGTAIR